VHRSRRRCAANFLKRGLRRHRGPRSLSNSKNMANLNMANLTPESIQEQITLLRRLVGLSTMLLGAFALYYCFSFVNELWNTPQRTLSICVTVASVVMIFIGAVIGLPELLPSKIVASSIFAFGIFTMLVGISILVRLVYIVFMGQQKIHPLAGSAYSLAIIAVGCGFAVRSFSKLRNRPNPPSTD